jgi:hypothetical protein
MLGVRLGFPNKERSRACLDPIAFWSRFCGSLHYVFMDWRHMGF